MSNPKWTPGPWGIERTSNSNWIGPMREDAKKVRSIVVHNQRGFDLLTSVSDQRDADADLIAAAPELYEALDRLLKDSWSVSPDWSREVWEAAYENAEAALAKARGEDR